MDASRVSFRLATVPGLAAKEMLIEDFASDRHRVQDRYELRARLAGVCLVRAQHRGGAVRGRMRSLLSANTLMSRTEHAPSEERSLAGYRWLVACLCADWCGACREFRADFDALSARHPDVWFRWIDIEDEADAIGDLDIETFPTLVIGGRDSRVRFAGPVLPQAGQIGRLLQSLDL